MTPTGIYLKRIARSCESPAIKLEPHVAIKDCVLFKLRALIR